MTVNLKPLGAWQVFKYASFGLLPARCLVCRDPAIGRDLCEACLKALPENRPACSRCALPLASEEALCGECLRTPPYFSSAIAPWRYEGALTQLLPRFKFHRDLACGRVLAELAITRLRAWPGWDGATAIVPLPLHPSRLGQRGYNQALELARPFAKAMCVPLRHDVLQRQRATAPQTKLDADQRRRNLRGAFLATTISGAVVLMDDVMTTGASVNEAARSLLRAGASEVRVVTMARVP